MQEPNFYYRYNSPIHKNLVQLHIVHFPALEEERMKDRCLPILERAHSWLEIYLGEIRPQCLVLTLRTSFLYRPTACFALLMLVSERVNIFGVQV